MGVLPLFDLVTKKVITKKTFSFQGSPVVGVSLRLIESIRMCRLYVWVVVGFFFGWSFRRRLSHLFPDKRGG